MENKSEMRLDILGFTLIGHIDALLYEPNYAANGQGRAYIVECKCVKEYTWKKVKEGEISNEWYGQCQFYPLMYDKEGMDTTYLIVKHRMTSDTLPPIRIKRNNKWIVDRLNVLKDVHTRLMEGLDEPDREHKTSRDSECKFCPFGNEIGDKSCWKMKES